MKYGKLIKNTIRNFINEFEASSDQEVLGAVIEVFENLYGSENVNTDAIALDYKAGYENNKIDKDVHLIVKNLYTFVLLSGECPAYYEWTNERQYHGGDRTFRYTTRNTNSYPSKYESVPNGHGWGSNQLEQYANPIAIKGSIDSLAEQVNEFTYWTNMEEPMLLSSTDEEIQYKKESEKRVKQKHTVKANSYVAINRNTRRTKCYHKH